MTNRFVVKGNSVTRVITAGNTASNAVFHINCTFELTEEQADRLSVVELGSIALNFNVGNCNVVSFSS